jgi:hypothetical protein
VTFNGSADINLPGVNTAGNQNTSGNAATASSPASGGSFITSDNIGSQSVNYADSAGSATNATNANTVTTITTAQVLNATAGASVDAVGTYAFAVRPGNTGQTSGNALIPGATVAGSVLRFSNSANGESSALSGTWRCMGFMQHFSVTDSYGNSFTGYRATLFLRIS